MKQNEILEHKTSREMSEAGKEAYGKKATSINENSQSGQRAYGSLKTNASITKRAIEDAIHRLKKLDSEMSVILGGMNNVASSIATSFVRELKANFSKTISGLEAENRKYK